jgi:hypothetical protein
MRRPLVLLPVLLLAAGCASGLDSAVFMAAPTAPADAEVRIYRTQRPACDYDELGIVTWQPKHGFQKLQSGVDKMRERAREMGGDAILGFSLGDRVDGSTTVSADSSGLRFGSSIDTRTVASGTVVRFRNGGCTH